MAILDVKLPELGESTSEATVLNWRKHPGDTVEKDDILVEVETDKVTLEVPAPAAGILRGVLKNEGETAYPDEIIATIDTGSLSGPQSDDTATGTPSASEVQGPGSDTGSQGSAAFAALAESDRTVTSATLSIAIDGTWTARDFSDFYRSLNELYVFRALVELERASLLEQETLYRDFIASYAPRASAPRQMIYMNALHLGMGAGNHHLIQPDFLATGDALLNNYERLIVRRCVFASPGITDLSGLGAVIGHIKDLYLRIDDKYLSGKRARALELQAQEDDIARKRREDERAEELHQETLRKARADNLKAEVEVLLMMGYSKAQARRIAATLHPATATLGRFVSTGQITNATVLSMPYDAEDKNAGQRHE